VFRLKVVSDIGGGPPAGALSLQPLHNRAGASVAAIRLNGGTGIAISGFPVGKPLPSLGHFNQKYLLLGIDGLAGIPQTPRRISLAVSRDRH
jgi:hypothetical protein